MLQENHSEQELGTTKATVKGALVHTDGNLYLIEHVRSACLGLADK